LADHVLARFEPEERAGIDSAVVRAADAVEAWSQRGIQDVMNVYNRPDDKNGKDAENGNGE
jgi:peptidyl-tRNA hydrolase